MTFKSKHSIVLAALAAAILLSACGKKAPLDDVPPRDENEKTSQSIWIPSA